jgi:hypothetical protein
MRAKDTSNRTTKTRKCTYGDKKKPKVDEKETKEIKTKQKREREALKSNETNVEHLQL